MMNMTGIMPTIDRATNNQTCHQFQHKYVLQVYLTSVYLYTSISNGDKSAVSEFKRDGCFCSVTHSSCPSGIDRSTASRKRGKNGTRSAMTSIS
jgi:hypothetical protein